MTRRGRPPSSVAPATVQLTTRVSAETVRLLHELADHYDEPIYQVLSEAIRAYYLESQTRQD